MKRKIKIVRVITRLVSGPAWHCIYLTKHLNNERFESVLVVGQPEPGEHDMLKEATEHGIQTLKISGLAREITFLKDLKSFIKLYCLLRKEKPDIVHTHTAKAGVLARLAAKLTGVPIIVHTYHGHIFEGYFGGLMTKLIILVEQLLARLSSKIIAISPSQKEELARFLMIDRKQKDKITVIPLGFEFDKFERNGQTTLRKKYKIGKNTKCIGIVGRLVPIKNHSMFLEAVERIVYKNPDIDAKFFIIGDGQLRTALESRIKEKGLEDYAIITGWLKDLEKVYPDLDATVVTSNNEGTPVSIIESIVSGCPVISTAVGGVTDIIEHGKTGILIEPGNTEQLVYYLEKVINEEDFFKDKTLKAKKDFIQNYSVENLVSNLSDVYTSLLNEGL